MPATPPDFIGGLFYRRDKSETSYKEVSLFVLIIKDCYDL